MNDNDPALPADVHEALAAGRQAQARRDFPAALGAYQRAAQLAPGEEAPLAALAALAMDASDWTGAERILRHLERQFPGRHRARLALTLFNLARYAEALPLLQALIDAGNTDISCILAYAATLERTGSEERAIDVLEQVYRAMPTAQFAMHLVSALLRVNRADLLDRRLPELIAQHPGDRMLQSSLSEHLLTKGEYAQGFDLMHYRWETSLEPSKAATLDCPEWDGRRFDGLLLVTAEQGLGDEILSSSVFGELVALGQRCLVECEARLLPVFRRSFPALDFTDRKGNGLHEALAANACRKITALELGRFFRRDAAAFPSRRRWLEPDHETRDALRASLQARFPGKRLTGVSWRSARMFLGNAKSIPLADLAPVLREPDSVFIDLQYGDSNVDRDELLRTTGLRVYALPEIDTTADIDGLFALVDALDDVVSCSNTTVHVAGALGKPVAAMIPGTRYALWYWGYTGDRTAWYPGVKLYRGPMTKPWLALAEDVARDRAGGKMS